MYPTLPFGPLQLPTAPILAIFAVMLALDVGGRYARRLGIHPDDLWNVGLIALAAGLIVARLWNVFQFWPIYQAEPILIFSIRPSGFEFWPGLVAAVLAGYAYLIYRALDPMRVAAALAVGGLAGGMLLAASGHATGAILGTKTDVPWALAYFGEMRHPAGLYQMVGLAFLSIGLWIVGDTTRPGRVTLMAVLGYSLLRLVTDSFVDNVELIGAFRRSQIVALAVALAASFALARRSASPRAAPESQEEPASTAPQEAPR
ncbi:MAG: prolipoprotein diacylglyceryl transferase [Caldilineaceae bacterium]|nr:prolipoprotein diacylglyceryl transferase [Caldilineaceae bacterium]